MLPIDRYQISPIGDVPVGVFGWLASEPQSAFFSVDDGQARMAVLLTASPDYVYLNHLSGNAVYLSDWNFAADMAHTLPMHDASLQAGALAVGPHGWTVLTKARPEFPPRPNVLAPLPSGHSFQGVLCFSRWAVTAWAGDEPVELFSWSGGDS